MNNLWNSFVTRILSSRLHRLFSGSTLLLVVTGRKSGRAISVPVNYAQSGRRLSATSRIERKWWRNLSPRADALRTPVSVLLLGRRQSGSGVAFSGTQSVNSELVMDGLKTVLSAHPGWGKAYGVATNEQGVPSASDLERAARRLVYIDIELDDPQAKAT